MSKTEWKPGDVAMVRLDADTEVRVTWNYDGWRSAKGSFYDPALPARPLVVIDPEDREQVERLAVDYMRECGLLAPDDEGIDAMQATLRGFANPAPPKPDEPTGLGAVVEDADGDQWVRAPIAPSDSCPWVNTRTGQCRAYDRVTAVRVLSEGVTA